MIKEFYNTEDSKSAIDSTCSLLGISVDDELCREYQAGLRPSLLSYEKVTDDTPGIPAIQRYLIGTKTYLAQPTQFYDIFLCCRQAPLLQVLATSLDTVVRVKVKNHEERLARLVRASGYDEFESLLYELAVAASRWRG